MGMQGHLIRIDQVLLDDFLTDSKLLEQLIASKTETEQVSFLELQDSWDGVQELLNSEPFENSEIFKRALMSYQLIDESQDLGYGPAHYHTKDKVNEINKHLQTINLEDIKSDKEKYFPFTFDDQLRVEGNIETFITFLDFMKNSAELNKAVIFYIT